MNIKIDKEFTTLAQAPKVKEDIKAFKAAFCEEDIATAARSVADCNGNAISIKGEAFPAGSFYDNVTHFHFTVFLFDWSEVIQVDFYCDMALTVQAISDYDGGPMSRVVRFERQ